MHEEQGDARPIAMCDVAAQYREIKTHIDGPVLRLLEAGQYILGAAVESFERDLARYVGVDHAVGVASGSDALALALRALGIGRGDEVVVPSWTFVATAHAVVRVGASPVFVDIDPETYCMSALSLSQVVGSAVRAVVPVHLYGHPADIGALRLAAPGVHVVEDCAQAMGARVGADRVGALGTIGAHSFFPTKNLGGCGDGGAVTTDDEALAARTRTLRQHGAREKNNAEMLGLNSRLDALQAIVLSAKLPFVDEWNRRRAALAAAYAERLAGLPVELPSCRLYGEHVWNQYTIQVADRPSLCSSLRARGIPHQVHYERAVHQQPYYRDQGRRPVGGLPATERVAARVLSLPMHPHLGLDEVDRVCAAVRAHYARGRR